MNVLYLTIAEFAEYASVSKQAIYKQVSNKNSQLSPYILRDGKRTLIKATALKELYGVDTDISTFTTPPEVEEVEIQPLPAGAEVEKATPPEIENQPFNPHSTANFQPVSTDYIEFLKRQVEELKEEKARTEERLTATIQEKDVIIKEQSAQLAELAKQVAQIADRALIATSQQQVLTAMEKGERAETETAGEQIVPIEPAETQRKSFWKRLFEQ